MTTPSPIQNQFSAVVVQSVGGGNETRLVLHAKEPAPGGLKGVVVAARHAFIYPPSSGNAQWDAWVERGFDIQAKNWEETGQVLDFRKIFE